MAAGIRWAAVRISAGSASATSRGRKSTTISCARSISSLIRLLDLGAEVGGHRREGEVEPALEWLHVAARHRDAVVRPDDAAQDVQRRVGAHQLEASRPVDLSPDLGADLGQGAGVGRDGVPDQPGLPAYAGDRHGALGTGQGPGVVRLAATRRVESGPVEPDALTLTIDLDDPSIEGGPVGVDGEQLGVGQAGGGAFGEVAGDSHALVSTSR